MESGIDTITEKIRDGKRISVSEGIVMWEEAPLWLLGALATERKRKISGDLVFYNRNFHIEPTNICVFGCRFCSYRRGVGSPDAWDLTIAQMEDIAKRYAGSGVTEVHIVGGVHPDHNLYYYIDLIHRIKTILPEATVKAFTAVELLYMIEKAGLGIEEGLKMLKQAGMKAIPGGGAEIFDEGLRSEICPEKGTADQWLAVHETAHRLAIPTNATILYGHRETLSQRMDHLDRLRRLQDRTEGFNAFIPLKFRSYGNPMADLGEVGIIEDMKMMAMSRIFLDNFPHIKAYWPMLGKKTTELALAFGADDIDGTIDDSTKIYSMAGAEDKKPSMTVGDIETLVSRAGLKAVERDTFYNIVKKH